MSNETCRLITKAQLDKYKQLEKENAKLLNEIEEIEQRLDEAEEVIKFYSDADQMTDYQKQMTAEKYHLIMGLKAIEYLEKWGLR